MKKVILLVLFMPYLAYGQIIENFESGNLNNWISVTEGHWLSDTTAAISGDFSLHHSYDNPEAGSDCIGIPLKNLHISEDFTRWTFLLRHGYDPSSSNNWGIFLISDKEPGAMSPDGNTNGYALGVNLTGYDDTLRLWKVKANQLTTVVNCHINWQNDIGISNAVKILAERSKEGNWTVSVSKSDGSPICSASGSDNELIIDGWFGIFYRYSSTRDRLLWFDDLNIEGKFYEDKTAPTIASCSTIGKHSVEIVLSEEPAAGLMIPDSISLNEEYNKPVSVMEKEPLAYIIEFADEFINKKSNILYINQLCDASSNCASDIQVIFTPVWAERGDVVISEIMADPLPEVSLPGKEFLEITNRTEYAFSLKDWILSTEDLNYDFPEITINPLEVLILCSSRDTSLFSEYGRTKGMERFPSLNDDGKILCLSDSSGTLIHGVEYSSEWYGDELKSGGGWSLEMKDTRYPFFDEGNWAASTSRKGGTPGSVNSLLQNNPDISFQGILNVFPEDSSDIIISFSEPVFDLSEKINRIQIGGKSPIYGHPLDPMYRRFIIRTEEPLQTGIGYQLLISSGIKDYAGNGIIVSAFEFGLPELSECGDIKFNELLFNPFSGDPDYIELYNCSGKVIDASRLQLVSIGDEISDTSQATAVSGEKRCIMPGSYYALTTSKEKISDRYFSNDPDHLFNTGSMPSMPDDKGHLILLNMELDRIDEVRYNEEMHYSLLSGYEGVALEKTAPENNSLDAINWHSASESYGWGTPGAPNSVYKEIPEVADRVVFSSSKITPDSDGTEDFLVICFNLTGNGNVVSVSVFDETGSFIRKISENMFAGNDATLTWDGTADDGSPVRTGIYVVFITLYDDTGKTSKWKRVCTVIRD